MSAIPSPSLSLSTLVETKTQKITAINNNIDLVWAVKKDNDESCFLLILN